MIMKKVINSLFVIIAAMVTFAGCAKQEIDAPATVETKTVQFFANSIETKTEFGTPDNGVYPTLWSIRDKVKILVNLESVKDTEKTVEIECSEDFRSAKFTSELVQPDAETFTFYSVSPSVALLHKSPEKLYVAIPSEQTPLAASVDKMAQLLFAMSETTETMPSSVELNYHHLTAYGKLSLDNLSSEVSSVSKIKIEAPEDMYLTGKWDYFLAEESLVVRSGSGSNTIVLTTSKTADIWFACAPVDVSGKTFTLTVTTDKGDFVKEITFPASRRFEAGRIAKFTVDMAGIEVEQPEETKTEWVATSFANLKEGDQVVIVSTKDQKIYAMPNDNGTSAPGVVAVSYANNKLSSEPEQKIVWYVGVDGSNRIFYAKSDKSTWAYCTNTNNGVKVGTNANKTFTLDGTTGYLKHIGTSRYLGVYNNQDWRCYTNTTGNTAGQTFQFFVRSGDAGGETPEPDPTPDPEPETPTYASLEDLVAAGQPTTDGTKVNVTLTDEEITSIYVTSGGYRNGVFLQVGEKEIEIYSYDVPEEWVVGGTISGTLKECVWKLYNTTWELCPSDWSELTYTAPAEVTPEPDPTPDPEQPGQGGDAGVVVLSEQFDNSTTSDSSAAISTSKFSNFSGATSKAYTSKYGGIKLGSSSAVGYITSKSLDLSSTFTVQIDACKYGSDTGNIVVTVGSQTQTISNSQLGAAGTFKTFTLTFEAATTSSTVKIATSSKRAYIDNVVITRN